MSSTAEGRNAEELVAKKLQAEGHSIISHNWRTRWCEIDIVSKKDNCVYFTEVKFRKSDYWGSGFDYITSVKLQQMKFAAEFWLAEQNWQHESQLLAAEVNIQKEITIIVL